MLSGELLGQRVLSGEIQREFLGKGGGFSSYEELPDKPQINNIELVGNKTSEELGLVGSTDYATTDGKAGIIVLNKDKGVFRANLSPELEIAGAVDSEIISKTSKYKPITPKYIDQAVKVGVTTNTIELTEEEKAQAQSWLGVDNKLDKNSTSGQGYGVYAFDNDGKQTTVRYTSGATSNTLALRTTNGRVEVGDAVNEKDAANKKYVDEQIFEVREVAEGKTRSFTIDTLSDLGTLLGIDTSVVSDEYTITSTTITYKEQNIELKQGDLFLIVDTNVPDYWVSVDDMKLYKMETTKVDLTEYAKTSQVDEINTNLTENYVKNTDYATSSKGGVVKTSSYGGIEVGGNGVIYVSPASNANIDAKTAGVNKPIVPATLDYAVKVGLTTNTETLTDEEKKAAQSWLGVSGSNPTATQLEDGSYSIVF